MGLLKLFEKNKAGILLHKKSVVAGIVLVAPQRVHSNLECTIHHADPPRVDYEHHQRFRASLPNQLNPPNPHVLLTLTATLLYAAYMLNKNKLLSLSAVFLLLPSFMLPYFQYWYTPFIFVYALIPQKKREVEVTVVWLIFMVASS